MNMHLLKQAAEKITMQDDMKQRLAEKCQAEALDEIEVQRVVFVEKTVAKPKNRYVRYAFACLATIVLLTVAGILLYNGVEFEVGTYEKGTEQCTQIIEDMENAFLETRKAGSGKILIEHPNAVGKKMEGEVILGDWRIEQQATNCQYYCFSIGDTLYLKKNQGYYYGYYVLREGEWAEQETPLRDNGYDYTYWISYLILDFSVPGAWYTTENLEEVTVTKRGGNTTYLFNYGTYGYRRFVVDRNQVVRRGDILEADMTVSRQCTFDPCEVQQVVTPFDEDIEALKKTKLDLDADGTLDSVAVEYLEDGVQVTVNDATTLLQYGKEIPAGYYAVPMEDMKRFLEQDADTGAVVLTMKASIEINTAVFLVIPEYTFCVIGYDGTNLYSLGNYQGLEFRGYGANAFYMQNKDMEIIEFLYDRENKALIEKAS